MKKKCFSNSLFFVAFFFVFGICATSNANQTQVDQDKSKISNSYQYTDHDSSFHKSDKVNWKKGKKFKPKKPNKKIRKSNKH